MNLVQSTKSSKRWLARPLLILAAAAALTVAPAVAGSPQVDDPGIQQAIETELILQKGVPFDSIDVTVADGIVTLSGTVDNILAEQRAIRLAESTRGTRSVIDRIDVLPAARPDTEIANDVEAALLADPAADSYEVTVLATDGRVTLSGTVDSWQERRLAETLAQQVRGVREVRNDLIVALHEQRPDTEIRADIRSRLDWNVRVDGALIDITVDDGAVTLTGAVGSAAEKRRAHADAWVAGVESVDSSGLEVKDWARDDRLRQADAVVKPDDAIADAIRDAFLYDPRVLSFEPEVAVSQGIVTLSGVVDSLSAKHAAEQVARNTVGVWRVHNHLKVRPAETIADTVLEHRVDQALTRDPYVEGFEIAVAARKGNINLYGAVDSYFEKYRASAVASRIDGVLSVDNNLTVEDDTLVYFDDRWDTTYGVDLGPASVVAYDWDYSRIRPADWEIRQDIRSQLFWSPFVDSDEVQVTVDDGIATLTGTVDSWHERQLATENAFEGGALAVVNQLAVEYGPDWLM